MHNVRNFLSENHHNTLFIKYLQLILRLYRGIYVKL